MSTPKTTTNVNWKNLTNLVSTVKAEKEMVFYVKMGRETERLVLTFPSFGGIRLCGKNEGFFKPEQVNEITYTENADGTLTLSAGTGITAIVNENGEDWGIKYCDAKGSVITEFSGKTLWYGYKGEGMVRVCIENTLDNDEVIFGLGERFNSFNRVGIKTDMWNADAWSTNDTSYKCIPIIHSTKGYMLYFNSSARAWADIGESDPTKYLYDVADLVFDFFVFVGTPLENIASYSALTGHPMLPPKWSLKFMPGATTLGWESRGKEKSMDLLKEAIEGYEKYGIDDISYIFGEDAFRDNKEAYDYVNSKGIRMFGWIHPFQADIRNREKMMADFLPNNSADPLDYDAPFFRKKSNPDEYSDNNTIDFSHPAAVELIKAMWGKNIEYGMRGMMIDFGEQMNDCDAVSYAGINGIECHNFHAHYYMKAYHDMYNELVGKGEWLTFGRNAAAGSQKYAANFAGDQAGEFHGLLKGLIGLLSFSTCGFSTYGSDIGGLGGPPTKELYNRWVQHGTFSPLMRAHGSDGAEVPWEQGDIDIFLKHYWFRESILDKIYSDAIKANKYAIPMVKAMAVAYPDDKSLLANEDQYTFCDDFLFCAVTEAGVTEREVTLPEGTWTCLFTGKVYEGGKTYTVPAPAEYSPVFIRNGAVIPVKVSADTLSLFDAKTNGNSADAVLITAADSTRVTEFWNDTENATAFVNAKNGDAVTVSADKDQTAKAVLAYGVKASEVTVDGVALDKANIVATDYGTQIILNGNWKEITIK